MQHKTDVSEITELTPEEELLAGRYQYVLVLCMKFFNPHQHHGKRFEDIVDSFPFSTKGQGWIRMGGKSFVDESQKNLSEEVYHEMVDKYHEIFKCNYLHSYHIVSEHSIL